MPSRRLGSTLAALVAVATATAVRGEEPKPPERLTLRVRVVTDEDLGPPVAGARVAVHDWIGDLAVGRTDEHGRAVLDLGPPSDRLGWFSSGCSLVVEASGGGRGHRVAEIGFRERVDDALVWMAERDVDLKLPPGAPLRGRVLDAATGHPVGGARVTAERRLGGAGGQGFEPPHPAEVSTGTDGAFLFEGLDAGEVCDHVVVRVAAAGHAPVERRIAVQAGRTNDAGAFRLESAGTIRGRVAEADGKAIAYRWLELESQFVLSPVGDAPASFVLTRTDEAGSFAFPCAAFGARHVVRAWTDGGWQELSQPGEMRGLVVTSTRPVADVALRLPNPDRPGRARLFVGVTAASSTALASDVWGSLELPGEDWSVASASGDPLTFRDVAPGRYRLRVTSRDLPPWSGDVEVAGGETPTRTRVAVGGKEVIAGRVVDDVGRGVPAAAVDWWTGGEWVHHRVSTDAAGAFRIAGLPAGRYRLQAMRNGSTPISDEVGVDAPAKDVRIVAPRTGKVAVRLVPPEGGALPRDVWSADGWASCEGDRVLVAGLRVGRRHVRIEPREPVADEYMPVEFDVDVKPDETADAGDARLERGASVPGVVLGPDGLPTSDAILDAGGVTGRPGVSGEFSLRPLPRGETEILVYSDGAASCVRVDPERPPAKLEIRLVAARRVLIDTAAQAAPDREWCGIEAVPRGASRPVPRAWGWEAHSGRVDARGIARLLLLPGEWTLRALSADETVRATADISVQAGDEPLRVALPVR